METGVPPHPADMMLSLVGVEQGMPWTAPMVAQSASHNVTLAWFEPDYDHATDVRFVDTHVGYSCLRQASQG